MRTKMYNVYLGFYKKPKGGNYEQGHIHTQVEAIDEEEAVTTVKRMFEVNNKGFILGTRSVMKVNTGFKPADMYSFAKHVLINRTDDIDIYQCFDKWYMQYKVNINSRC